MRTPCLHALLDFLLMDDAGVQMDDRTKKTTLIYNFPLIFSPSSVSIPWNEVLDNLLNSSLDLVIKAAVIPHASEPTLGLENPGSLFLSLQPITDIKGAAERNHVK